MRAYPRYLPRYLISDIKNPHPIRSRYPIFRTLVWVYSNQTRPDPKPIIKLWTKSAEPGSTQSIELSQLSQSHSNSIVSQFSESTRQTRSSQNWANSVPFTTAFSDSPEPVSNLFRVRFEFRLKRWIRSWVPEILEEFHSLWATDPASTSLYLEQLLGIGAFFKHLWVLSNLTSHYCDILHTYFDICSDW